MLSTIVKALGVGVVATFAIIQLVPYGRRHESLSVQAEPPWDSRATRELARRACFDCHGNETVWPWYSHVAPISWLVQHDVDEGRSVLNFHEWNRSQPEAHEAADTVREGEMPLPFYLLTHPEARLSSSEKAALADGLARTMGRKRGTGQRREGDEHEDE